MVTSRKIAAIPYYGSKAWLMGSLRSAIECSPHRIYVEPCVGGGALFFAMQHKESRTHVLNDANQCLVMLYRGLQLYPKAIRRELGATLFSHGCHKRAKNFIATADCTDLSQANVVAIAAATYISLCQGVSSIMGTRTGWRINRVTDGERQLWQTRIDRVGELASALRSATVDCDDLLKVIARWDGNDTLFVCDPPYPGTACGHYGSKNRSYSVGTYTQADWTNLCALLDRCRGDYILFNYVNTAQPLDFDVHLVISKQSKTRPTAESRETLEHIWIRIADKNTLLTVIYGFYSHKVRAINWNPASRNLTCLPGGGDLLDVA
jgi:DNA adenine methylase